MEDASGEAGDLGGPAVIVDLPPDEEKTQAQTSGDASAAAAEEAAVSSPLQASAAGADEASDDGSPASSPPAPETPAATSPQQRSSESSTGSSRPRSPDVSAASKMASYVTQGLLPKQGSRRDLASSDDLSSAPKATPRRPSSPPAEIEMRSARRAVSPPPESPLDDVEAPPVDDEPWENLSEIERRLPDPRERALVMSVLHAEIRRLEEELKRIEEEDDDDPPPRMTCAEKLWECWLSWRGLLFIGYGT